MADRRTADQDSAALAPASGETAADAEARRRRRRRRLALLLALLCWDDPSFCGSPDRRAEDDP
jgi:hypothetical protein